MAAKLENLVALNQVNFHIHTLSWTKVHEPNFMPPLIFSGLEGDGRLDIFFSSGENIILFVFNLVRCFCRKAGKAHKV